MLQQRSDVLADVMILRSLEEILRARSIMLQRGGRDVFEIGRAELH